MTDHIEIKAALTVEADGSVTGLAWPFGTPDRTGDEIMPGAFAKAVCPMPMLDSHDQGQTVGVWDSAIETPEGLQVNGRLLVDDIARAREVRALLRERAVTGLSIGFQIHKATNRKGGAGRIITDLELLEVSIVAIPCHAGARITSSKGHTMTDNTAPNTDTADIEARFTADTSALQKRLDRLEAKGNRATDENAPAEASDARKAFGIYLRKGGAAADADLKALNTTSDSQGGYIAPEEISTEILRDLVEFSPIRSVASVRGITAPSVKYPRRREGITNAQWADEEELAVESTMTFGQIEVAPHKLTTFVDISNELLADSGGTAEAEVRLALAEDFGQKEGAAFVNGTGVGQPEGLLVNPDIVEVAATSATEINPDELIALMYGLPAMYRNRGTWGMNGSTLAKLRTVTDGDGRYLWQPSFQVGQPETVLGRPVVEVVDMPDAATGNSPILFGDFEAYRIVDRMAMSILVNPYLLATRGVTRIHATRRVGGRVIQAARFRKYSMA